MEEPLTKCKKDGEGPLEDVNMFSSAFIMLPNCIVIKICNLESIYLKIQPLGWQHLKRKNI